LYKASLKISHMESKLIAVKILYLNDLRRISLDSNSMSYQSIKDMIGKLYRIPTEHYQYLEIYYKDDEDDLVIIATDIEIKEALYLIRKTPHPSPLRLTLKLNVPQASSPSTQSTPTNSSVRLDSTQFPNLSTLPTRILELLCTGKREDIEKAYRIIKKKFLIQQIGRVLLISLNGYYLILKKVLIMSKCCYRRHSLRFNK